MLKPVKQIILLHANLLNSHFLGDIIQMYRDHGYKFITLEEALENPAKPFPVGHATTKPEATQKAS